MHGEIRYSVVSALKGGFKMQMHCTSTKMRRTMRRRGGELYSTTLTHSQGVREELSEMSVS